MVTMIEEQKIIEASGPPTTMTTDAADWLGPRGRKVLLRLRRVRADHRAAGDAANDEIDHHRARAVELAGHVRRLTQPASDGGMAIKPDDPRVVAEQRRLDVTRQRITDLVVERDKHYELARDAQVLQGACERLIGEEVRRHGWSPFHRSDDQILPEAKAAKPKAGENVMSLIETVRREIEACEIERSTLRTLPPSMADRRKAVADMVDRLAAAPTVSGSGLELPLGGQRLAVFLHVQPQPQPQPPRKKMSNDNDDGHGLPRPGDNVRRFGCSPFARVIEEANKAVDETQEGDAPPMFAASMPDGLACGGGVDLPGLLIWMFRDVIVERLQSMLPRDAAGAVSQKDRVARSGQIAEQLLALERREAELLASADDQGMIVAHRAGMDPRCALHLA